MKPIAIALLAAALCISCRSPANRPIQAATAPPELTGKYQFATADLLIELDLRADRTYYAAMDSWAHLTTEQGHWQAEGDSIILRAESGALKLPIRRLEVVRNARPGTLRIQDPDSQLVRALILSKAN